MQISEPMTMATDYLVAALAVFLGSRLWRRDASGWSPARLWAVSFFALAVAAAAGGTAHGFRLQLGEAAHAAIWKATVWSIGIAGAALVGGEIVARFDGAWRRALIALVAFKLGVYCAWMAAHDDFRYVIWDYAPALVAVLALEIWAWTAARAPSARWVVGGILVSFAAAGVQLSGFSLHRHFNHNDLYHVVQMVGLYLLYRGGLLLGRPAVRE